jgi:hypothetical protein
MDAGVERHEPIFKGPLEKGAEALAVLVVI